MLQRRKYVHIVGWVNWVSWMCGLAGAILIVIMMLIVTYEVIMRYVFKSPTGWQLSVTEFMLVASTFLAAAYTLREDGHVMIDIVVARMRPKARAVLNFVGSIVALSYCTALTWQSWLLFSRAYQLGWRDSSSWMFPLAPVYLMIPVGCFLLCIQYLVKLYGYAGSIMGRSLQQPIKRAE